MDDARHVGGVQGARRALEQLRDLGQIPALDRAGGRGGSRRRGSAGRRRAGLRSQTNAGRTLRRSGRAGDLGGQGLARHVAHHDVGNAVLLARAVHRADARVVEARGDLGFTQEAFPQLAREGGEGGQDLDRDLALQPLVPGETDPALPAAPDLRQDAVASDARALSLRGAGVRRFLGDGRAQPGVLGRNELLATGEGSLVRLEGCQPSRLDVREEAGEELVQEGVSVHGRPSYSKRRRGTAATIRGRGNGKPFAGGIESRRLVESVVESSSGRRRTVSGARNR